MAGSLASNFHDASRSEYFAVTVFSDFGSAVQVPRQEDTGIDLYCTLTDRVGQNSWVKEYYSVQVKSNRDPWVFKDPASVQWFIEHPLPIFLCVVIKPESRFIVYQTSPRFAAWVLPEQPATLTLIPGTVTESHAIQWGLGEEFNLGAPILDFTIQDLNDRGFHELAKAILRFWIRFDVENLFRIHNGIHQFWVPHKYETNKTTRETLSGWSGHGGSFREESLPVARRRLKELLGILATHYMRHDDMITASILAMALRHLSPEGYSGPDDPDGNFDPDRHNHFLQGRLNSLVNRSGFVYAGVDHLLDQVKKELGPKDIAEQETAGPAQSESPPEA